LRSLSLRSAEVIPARDVPRGWEVTAQQKSMFKVSHLVNEGKLFHLISSIEGLFFVTIKLPKSCLRWQGEPPWKQV